MMIRLESFLSFVQIVPRFFVCGAIIGILLPSSPPGPRVSRGERKSVAAHTYFQIVRRMESEKGKVNPFPSEFRQFGGGGLVWLGITHIVKFTMIFEALRNGKVGIFQIFKTGRDVGKFSRIDFLACRIGWDRTCRILYGSKIASFF